MYNLSNIDEIQVLLKKHGFAFSKSLGQNFIIDEDVCPEMAEAAVPSKDYGVLEIGPGIGVLTVELCERAKKVVSIELDTRLLPILDETLKDYDNVEIVNADVMKLNLKELLEEKFKGMPVVVCANLPYYITSPVIMSLLENNLPIESITVMVQAEAADRLCADVGTRAAGAVTVAVSFYADASELFFVPKTSFMPSPKVDSKVMKLTLKKDASHTDGITDEKAFFKMVKAAFSQRRKTILNSLSSEIPGGKEGLANILEELNIPKTARIEELTFKNLKDIFVMKSNTENN